MGKTYKDRERGSRDGKIKFSGKGHKNFDNSARENDFYTPLFSSYDKFKDYTD